MIERPTMRVDDAQSSIRASASAALAKALITGFGEAEQAGYPLNQIQMAEMAKMSIMAYEEIIKAVDEMQVLSYIGKMDS